MRALLVFSLVTLGAGAARATVTEPNGLVVPRDSANGEKQLYTYFANQSEAIDWQVDAHEDPATFSPLCSFNATYVLNQAGNHYGLAWYNVPQGTTPAPPTGTDLHQLVAAGAAVGTSFNGDTIRNDPAYAGGLVGFALVGGQTHYSQSGFDVVCTDTTKCPTPGSWILALIYKSVNTANAYYMAFEDGNVTASSFANDGDYNDDVYFVQGISCAGAGQPCDTGLMGVCAGGITNCNGTTGMLECEQVQTSSSETCNGIDDDCNGSTDDGATCPPGDICSHGNCIPKCNEGEFPCGAGTVCNTDGTCVTKDCVGVTCSADQICTNGVCHGGCDGVVCPGTQVCRAGECVDPCAGVVCADMKVCKSGVCIESCACQPCPTGESCGTDGTCQSTSCVGVTCAAGTVCNAGTCVDDCAGVVCPFQQTCEGGACVAAPPAPDMATSGDGSTGGSADLADLAGTGGSSDASDGGTSDGSGSGKHKGCGCTVGGAPGGTTGPLVVALVALALVLRRKRAL